MQHCIGCDSLPDVTHVQTHHIQKKPIDLINENHKSYSSESSRPNEFKNTTTNDDKRGSGHKRNHTPRQSVHHDLKHTLEHVDSIPTDQLTHTRRYDTYYIHRLPSLSLKTVQSTFILMMIWLAISGYVCLYARAPRYVVEPSHIDHNVRISTPVQPLQCQDTHVHLSTPRSINSLYNPVQQPQEPNYIRSLGSVAVVLFGGFVSESRVFALILFLSFNLPVSIHAQHFDCIGNYGSSACNWAPNDEMTCDQTNADVDCTVDCTGTHACHGVQIYGGAGPLFVNCYGEAACYSATIHVRASALIDIQGNYDDALGMWGTIYCNTTEYCNITAQGSSVMELTGIYANIVSGTKLFVNAIGQHALKDAWIYCPIDHYSCNIYAEGDGVMNNTQIYAVESFLNAHIECDARQFAGGGTSVLHCAEFEFGQSCELQCPQNDVGIEFADKPDCGCDG
eukprot:436825_1